MIIHISGPSGSGKTTLGKKLKKKFGEKIVVKDLDDLVAGFLKSRYRGDKPGIEIHRLYQNHIDNYIKKHKDKTIVFVGLAVGNTGNYFVYYDVHADHKYYIELDDDLIVEKKCERFLVEYVPEAFKNIRDVLMYDNKMFIKDMIKLVKQECDSKEIKRNNKIWNREHKKLGYKFMTREEIFKKVFEMIKNS